MTALATDIIAIRAALGWAVGLVGTGLIAGYLAALPSGRPQGWAVIPILAARMLLLLGPAGVGLIAGRLISGQGKLIAYSTVGASIVVSMWLSLIAAQVAVNLGCLFFGAKTEPIRWWSGDNRKRRSRSKLKSRSKEVDAL